MHIHVQTLVGTAGLLTTLTPYIAAVFTQRHFPRWANEVIALYVSVLFGVLSWVIAGGSFSDVHDIGSLYASIAAVVVGAKVYYQKLAQASPTLAAIEWLTGGKQNGFPAPQSAFASSSPAGGEPIPVKSTDTSAVSTFSPTDSAAVLAQIAGISTDAAKSALSLSSSFPTEANQ